MRFAIAVLGIFAVPALAQATILDVRLPWNHNRTIIRCMVVSESNTYADTINAELNCGERGTMSITSPQSGGTHSTSDFVSCDAENQEPNAVSITRYTVGNEVFSGIDGSACR